jgi:hypothetical protein
MENFVELNLPIPKGFLRIARQFTAGSAVGDPKSRRDG